MKPLRDCRLYGFIDTGYTAGRAPELLARELCLGGADILQLRAKDLSPAEVERIANRILPITSAAGVPLVINDHLAVAVATQASLLHLGQEDFFDAGHRHVSELLPAGSAVQFTRTVDVWRVGQDYPLEIEMPGAWTDAGAREALASLAARGLSLHLL